MRKRLNKFLAECSVASRRKCDLLIQQGRVRVNGDVATVGMIIDDEKDVIEIDGKKVKSSRDKRYFVLYKPKGYVTTAHDERGRKTVFDLIDVEERLFPVGRLDKDTTGVLLLTNDGEMAYKLTHPKYGIQKVYVATLRKPLTDSDVKKLIAGIRLDDGICVPDAIKILDEQGIKVEIILSEGRNRVVRRLFEALGNEVKRLKRINFGGITVKGMRPGEIRELKPAEIEALKNKIDGKSTKSI